MAQELLTLISMKRPKAGAAGSDRGMPAAASPKGPEYGWGLVLRLENFELDKLKMKKLPVVGQKFHIDAQGYVESVHESQSLQNKGDRSIGIQITDLALAEGEMKD